MKIDAAVIGDQDQSESDIGEVLGHRGCRFVRRPMDWPDQKVQLAAMGQGLLGIAHDLANVFQVVMADAEAIRRNLNNPIRVAESARRIERQATLGVEIGSQIRMISRALYGSPMSAMDLGSAFPAPLEASRSGGPNVTAEEAANHVGLGPSVGRDIKEAHRVRVATEED
ncbi:hypothetical protein HZB60_03945 [candidate division KSB1 bacterium]|nr:hypothetical protein [candidate division KSB1 bacterium]